MVGVPRCRGKWQHGGRAFDENSRLPYRGRPKAVRRPADRFNRRRQGCNARVQRKAHGRRDQAVGGLHSDPGEELKRGNILEGSEQSLNIPSPATLLYVLLAISAVLIAIIVTRPSLTVSREGKMVAFVAF